MSSLFAYAVMAISGLGGAAALVMSMTEGGGLTCPKCKKDHDAGLESVPVLSGDSRV